MNKGKEISDKERIKSATKIAKLLLSTIVFGCRGDGVLGAKEEKYCIEYGQRWNLTDDEIKECLKGKDCSKEFVDAVGEEHKDSAHDIKSVAPKHLVFHVLIACTQDGLAQAELDSVYKMAQKLNVDKQIVKNGVEILKLEQKLANATINFIANVPLKK